MASLSARGVKFHYHDTGAGSPPFVFVHGWACDSSAWALQVEDLERDHRCLSIDLRGRGRSAAVAPYDVATAADDVAAIMDHAGTGPAIVVGHSLGGVIALVLNEMRPDLVMAVVAGDSPLDGARSGSFDAFADQVEQAGSMEAARTFVEGFFVEETAHDIREHVRKMMLGCPAPVAAGMLRGSASYGPRMDALLKLADEKPFMAIWAGRPLSDVERLRSVTMFVRQEPLPGTGHFFQMEQPALTNALLRAFVDDVRRDPRLQKAP